LKILRVYGKKQELEDYPNPFFMPLIKKKYRLKDTTADKKLKDVSLHHIIRDANKCPFAQIILNLEEWFIQIYDNPTKNYDEFMKIDSQYKEIIKDAEQQFLEEADIILMTCSANQPKRIETFNIKQLIIDECSMSMEPESMSPMILNHPEQIILLGDHQQLKPVVTEKLASQLGLETSLFERYHENAFMLTKQYRMQKSIAEFPSKQFYKNRLEVGNENQNDPSQYLFWPGGPKHPIVFLHNVGEEKGLNVSSEDGGQQSKSNELEINNAVNIAFRLVHRFKINQSSIAILSQYRAQCTLISKNLISKNLSGITVQTVVSAQGSEWDYVILSTVRSLPASEIEREPSIKWRQKHLGFIIDYHQINVALTRSRLGLIILGNKLLLRTDAMWRNLLEHYESKSALIEAKDFKLF
ncbi:hypothetical protein HELRODRAFT_68663, partial [Helobdella robusta]